MASAGYSGTPLLKKLGILPGMKLLLMHAPSDYYNWLSANSGISTQVLKAQQVTADKSPDFIHLFAASGKVFETAMKKIQPLYQLNTSLTIWVSWYKKASKITTDLTEESIRNYALANGLVDVKVCAVNEIWSGLKLVVPLAKR